MLNKPRPINRAQPEGNCPTDGARWAKRARRCLRKSQLIEGEGVADLHWTCAIDLKHLVGGRLRSQLALYGSWSEQSCRCQRLLRLNVDHLVGRRWRHMDTGTNVGHQQKFCYLLGLIPSKSKPTYRAHRLRASGRVALTLVLTS